MLYISYMHALNIPCKLETSGDWHWGAYKWKNFKSFYAFIYAKIHDEFYKYIRHIHAKQKYKEKT